MTSQVALYARVSSEKQADTNTIASQIAVLQERIQSDGETLAGEMQFIDDGFSQQKSVNNNNSPEPWL